MKHRPIHLLIVLSLCIHAISCLSLQANLTETSSEQLLADLKGTALVIQYHLPIGNSSALLYITSNTRLLALSPESRFYSFGTVYSGFKFSNLSYDGYVDEFNNSTEVTPKQLKRARRQEIMLWFASQTRQVYLAKNEDISSSDKQLCMIEYPSSRNIVKALNFKTKPEIYCMKFEEGSKPDQTLTDVTETKELVQAVCILFITIITMVWLQSSFMKFENESRSKPFHFTFICNDLDISAIDLWCHFFSSYTSVLIVVWRVVVGTVTCCVSIYKACSGKSTQDEEFERFRLIANGIVRVATNNSPEGFVLMKRIVLTVLILMVLTLGFSRAFVPTEWPSEGYTAFDSVTAFLAAKKHSAPHFNSTYFAVWIVCTIVFLLTHAILTSLSEWFIALEDILIDGSVSTKAFYTMIGSIFSTCITTIYVILISCCTPWSSSTKAIFLVISCILVYFTSSSGLVSAAGSIDNLRSRKLAFLGRVASVYLLQFLHRLTFAVLSFFTADVVFGFIWYNVQNVIIYADRLTWIAFVGLIITTLKTMFDDMTLPFRISREILMESAAVIRIPKVSTFGEEKKTFKSERVLRADIDKFTWLNYEDRENQLHKILGSMRLVDNPDVPDSIPDVKEMFTSNSQQEKGEASEEQIHLELTFLQAQKFCDDVEGFEPSEDKSGDYVNLESEQPVLSHEVGVSFRRMFKNWVAESQYSCAIQDGNRVIVPLNYSLFFEIHHQVIGRSNIISDIISKNLLIAIGSAIIFLAFSSMNSSNQDGNDLFNNVIVVVTVFLPAILSTTNRDSLKDLTRNRLIQEMKSKCDNLKKHMMERKKVQADQVYLAVLHTHHCSTVTSFQQNAGIMTPHWLTSPYKCLNAKSVKKLEKFWKKCTNISKFGFVVELRSNPNFTKDVLKLFMNEQENGDPADICEAFWGKLINAQDDGIITLNELKNFDHIIHAIMNSLTPEVWLCRLVFELEKDSEYTISIQKLRTLTYNFTLIGKNMLENKEDYMGKLDYGMQNLLAHEYKPDAKLTLFAFIAAILHLGQGYESHVGIPPMYDRLFNSDNNEDSSAMYGNAELEEIEVSPTLNGVANNQVYPTDENCY